MPGLKWANDDELLYLTTKLNDFSVVIHSNGKARVKKHAKLEFLNKVYDEYDKLYPGRIASMDLPNIGTQGSLIERKVAMIDVSNFV
jgi:hypothetical protein